MILLFSKCFFMIVLNVIKLCVKKFFGIVNCIVIGLDLFKVMIVRVLWLLSWIILNFVKCWWVGFIFKIMDV